MSRYTFTLLGFMLMAGFGIFFGIEIATRGMEQIQGPLLNNYSSTTETVARVPQYASTPIPIPTPSPKPSALNIPTGGTAPAIPMVGTGAPANAGDSSVNRIGNGIGDLLQGVANVTIRSVVGIFDGLIN